MCRMIGITNFSYEVHKPFLEEFFKLAKTGMVPPGNIPGHLDGWGIGYYKNGKANILKSAKSVLKEKDRFFASLKKINRSKILIIHLRKSAWKRSNLIKNTHPFKYKNVLYCHNGTVLDYKPLIKDIKKDYPLSENALDSEVFFKYALSQKQKTIKGRFNAALSKVSRSLKHTSLTSLFSDGAKLYTYRELRKLPLYYTLFLALYKNSSIVSSEPLAGKLKWKLLKEKKIKSM
jgi:glutamine amidotransferase